MAPTLRVPVLIVLALCATIGPASAEPCAVRDPDGFLDRRGRTAPPTNALPSPATNNDCGFYNWAWRTFMYVTAKTASDDPLFLHYRTIETAFPGAFDVKNPDVVENVDRSRIVDLNPTKIALASAPETGQADQRPILNDGARQAAQGGVGATLVDQNGNPVFYSINLNEAYAEFVRDNRLDDIPRLLAKPIAGKDDDAVPADLEFRPGALELKSAWMIIDGPVSRYSNYIVARARVPTLKNVIDADGGTTAVEVDSSRPAREVNVALLGLHVVGAIDGHPEFVWATFEHAGPEGRRDIAPAAEVNPDPAAPGGQAVGAGEAAYPLFPKGGSAQAANVRLDQRVREDQKFATPTPVYRVFPGSQAAKPADGEAAAPWEDPAVYNLNAAVGELFAARDPRKADARRNYRLVGAVWIDQPRAVAPADAQKNPVVDADGNEVLIAADGRVPGGANAAIVRNFDAALTFAGEDGRLAGENRLSNMALESFTQPSDAAPHCLSCHNTEDQVTSAPGRILWARRINMSHALSIAVEAYLTRHPDAGQGRPASRSASD
ncbi:MAG: hypothetical protein ABR970_18770 [Roseiarcus sp.]